MGTGCRVCQIFDACVPRGPSRAKAQPCLQGDRFLTLPRVGGQRSVADGWPRSRPGPQLGPCLLLRPALPLAVGRGGEAQPLPEMDRGVTWAMAQHLETPRRTPSWRGEGLREED